MLYAALFTRCLLTLVLPSAVKVRTTKENVLYWRSRVAWWKELLQLKCHACWLPTKRRNHNAALLTLYNRRDPLVELLSNEVLKHNNSVVAHVHFSEIFKLVSRFEILAIEIYT